MSAPRPVLPDGFHDAILADIVSTPRDGYDLHRFVWVFPDDRGVNGKPFRASLLAIASDWKSNIREVASAIEGKPIVGDFDTERLIGRSSWVRTKVVKRDDKVFVNVLGAGDIKRPRKIFQSVPFGFVRAKDKM
jgi:hypothetical protein